MACLSAITANGQPLFIRSYGGMKPLSFPTVASLSGVHMYANTNDISINTVHGVSSSIAWKIYHSHIVLILSLEDHRISNDRLSALLDIIFASMVFTVSIDEIIGKDVDRLKKTMKSTYEMVDAVMTDAVAVDINDRKGCTLVAMAAAGSILTPEIRKLEPILSSFVTTVGTTLGALSFHGRVAIATKGWWKLSNSERLLLSLFSNSVQPHASIDMPVYLPFTSPNIPHRLVTLVLMKDVVVTLILGPTPSFQNIETLLLATHWTTSLSLCTNYIRFTSGLLPIPADIAVDRSLIGFVLVNRVIGKLLSGVRPVLEDDMLTDSVTADSSNQFQQRQAKPSRFADVEIGWNVLETFVGNVIEKIFNRPYCDRSIISADSSTVTSKPVLSSQPFGYTKNTANDFPINGHLPIESFVVAQDHKLFALQKSDYEIYILFSASIPSIAIRGVSHDTLHLLTNSRSFSL